MPIHPDDPAFADWLAQNVDVVRNFLRSDVGRVDLVITQPVRVRTDQSTSPHSRVPSRCKSDTHTRKKK